MRSKRRKLKTKNRGHRFIKTNQKLIILIALYFFGSVLGALSVKNADTQLLESIKEITENFILQKNSQSILQNFCANALTDIVFLSLSMVFGLCLVGEPVLWLLPLIRGLGLGLATGYIYRTFSTTGVLFCIAIIYIPSMLSVTSTILSCKESILTSKDLLKIVKGRKPLENPDYFKMFFIRNAILFGLMLFSSGLSATLTYFFAGKIILLS